MVIPFFLSNSKLAAKDARDCARWFLVAASAESSMIFFSAGLSVSHTFLLKMTDCGLYWWLVNATNFCTSQNLLAAITAMGFS